MVVRGPGPLTARVRRHPRRWGLLFAVLLLGAYAGALRPARAWVTAAAAPLSAWAEAPEGQSHAVVVGESGKVLLAVPAGPEGAVADAVAVWDAPAGVLFLLPAVLLIAAFPTRPFWLHLLGAHGALGLVTLAAFALGQRLGWTPFAAAAYTFVATYVAAMVSLGVPVLLFLAGRAPEPGGRHRGAAAPEGCIPAGAMVGSGPRVRENARGHAILNERDHE